MGRKNMSTNDNDKRAGRRRKFTPEYKAEVVRLCRDTGKSSHAVARELGLTPSAVANWVQQADVDAKGGGTGPLTSAERDELSALRREVRTLRQERDILKKATAFFAKEGTS
jgi:transposase